MRRENTLIFCQSFSTKIFCNEMYGYQSGELVCGSWGLKGETNFFFFSA